MANPMRGEVAITIGARDYVLRLSYDALVQLEDATGQGVEEVFQALDRPGPKLALLRTVFWATLRDRHPDITVDQAGEMLLEATPGTVLKAVEAAATRAMPAPEVGRKPGPRKAATNGTGRGSSKK